MNIDPNKERIEKLEEEVSRLTVAMRRVEKELARTATQSLVIGVHRILDDERTKEASGVQTLLTEIDTLRDVYQKRMDESTDPMGLFEEFRRAASERLNSFLGVAALKALESLGRP